MTKILESLTKVRDNTARMLNRLTLWMDDEIVAAHRILPNLKSSQLLTVLQLLRQRYDAEWEVKEMVVSKYGIFLCAKALIVDPLIIVYEYTFSFIKKYFKETLNLNM